MTRLGYPLPILCLALAPLLWGFTGFSPVKNVCPSCARASGAGGDVLVLLDGRRLQGKVLAQNPRFFILERFGEIRAVDKRNVASVQWDDHKPSTAGQKDQLHLKSGLVLLGRITEKAKGRYLIIQVANKPVIVWLSQIEEIYEKGKLQPIR